MAAVRKCQDHTGRQLRRLAWEFLKDRTAAAAARKNPDDAKAPALVAKKIISLLSSPIVIEGTECNLGVSVGISLYPEDAHDTDELIVMADAAMYQAKGLGGNVVVFHQLPRAVEAKAQTE